MNEILSLGYSTCPNDTFIFHALAHKLVDMKGLDFDIRLKDVEQLNRDAKNGLFHVSKLSFAALGHIPDSYGLLKSGAALGRGCGPLIVARPGTDIDSITRGKVAVPGLWTTACMLLGLFMGEQPNATAMVFDAVMPAVSEGLFDFGVIIHEGRFTYENYGLVNLLDLGAWWEEETGLPIPLGGIAIRRDIPQKTAEKVESIIRASVQYAFAHENKSSDYIRLHAKEMEPSVVKRHIELYVNDFSISLGQEGAHAVEALFARARQACIIPKNGRSIFALENS